MHDPLVCPFTKPIQAFYKTFSEMPNVQKSIRDEFKHAANAVLKALHTEQPLGEQEDQVYSLIHDLITSESEEIDRIIGLGEFEFKISINRFGDAYWVSAIEFEAAGLFTCIDDAKRFAYHNFSSFIEAQNEKGSQGG
jgi:hypothetical protein